MVMVVDAQVSISIDEGFRDGFEEEDEVTSRPKKSPFSRFGNPGSILESQGTEIKAVWGIFWSGLGGLKTRTKAVNVYRCCDLETSRSRKDVFHIYTEAVKMKRGSDANIKLGWYSASREQIGAVIAHGFSSPARGGLCLSSAKHAADSVIGAEVDESGLRHVLMCRVILGKQEEIKPGSDQCYPSSMEFDTGVDCLNDPRKYIIWSAYSNAYILPIYVISFKIDPLPQGLSGMRSLVAGRMRMRPTSAWVKFSNLVNMLGKILPQSQMAQINKCYKNFCEKKIGRQEMIFKLRLIAGDKLLAATIKQFRDRA